MFLAYQIGEWLFYVLKVLAVGVEAWAFVDAVRTPASVFQRVGSRTKGFWLALTGAALAVGLVEVLIGPGGGGFGLFGLVAVCVSAVYLAGPRDDLRFHRGGR